MADRAMKAVMSRTAAQTRDGDRASAFRSLAERHLDTSYRLARVILADPNEAEDAVHDAFVMAWAHWASLRDQASFEHWFRRIVVNTYRNRLRRSSRWRVQDISAEVTVEAHDLLASSHDRDALHRALTRLRPDDRVVLALRYYRDLKVDDIALALDIAPGTVMSRIHHALRRLRMILDETGGKDAFR
jgi:RNA polymerase sigma-70 factor (ECF subfamily)